MSAYQRPIVGAEQLIDHPEAAVRWWCPACECLYVVDLPAMYDARISSFAFQVWGHYHLFRAGSEHQSWIVRGEDKVPTAVQPNDTIEIVGTRDLHEAMAWWDGFALGKRTAVEELREPLEKKMRELEGKG